MSLVQEFQKGTWSSAELDVCPGSNPKGSKDFIMLLIGRFNHILKKMLKLARDASAFMIFLGFFLLLWMRRKLIKNTRALHMGFDPEM